MKYLLWQSFVYVQWSLVDIGHHWTTSYTSARSKRLCLRTSTFQDQHSTKWSSLTSARKKKKKKTAKRRRSFSAARTADPTNLKLLLTFTAILTAHCSFEGIAGWPALQLALLHCAVLDARKSFRDPSSIFFIIRSTVTQNCHQVSAMSGPLLKKKSKHVDYFLVVRIKICQELKMILAFHATKRYERQRTSVVTFFSVMQISAGNG